MKNKKIKKRYWQDSLGNQFLKLSATNYAINLLICGKDCKKSGLSNGEKLNELKSMRNAALEGADNNVDEWEEVGVERPAKFRRDMERTVSIQVQGVSVTVLCPAKRAKVSDMMVKMEAHMLGAIYRFLQPDCLENVEARTYKRSGLYSKLREDGCEERKD